MADSSEALFRENSNSGSPTNSQGLPPANSVNGLTVVTASIFIVGSICGGGVLAIPQAVVDCGVVGALVVVACGIISAFTGYILGKCWTVLKSRYPEYKDQGMTDPYPTIAFRAGGKVARIATRICIHVTLFGGGTVFLLLVAGNISQLIHDLSPDHKDFSLCYLMPIVTAVLTPITWRATPKEFWQAAAVAAATSILAAIFVLACIISAIPEHPSTHHSPPTPSGFFSAFGTILFAFGGASCFPTIQVDMKESRKFPKAAIIGICVVMSVYLMVGIPGYVIIGDKMQPNVISAIPAGWKSYTVNFLITFHLMMAFIIIMNPVAQEIEGILNVNGFGHKRVIIRTLLAASSMFVGVTIPHFNVILSLLGGSTIACTNFIFPPLYYYLLSRQEHPSKAHGPLPSCIRDDETPSEVSTIRNVPYEWEQINISLLKKVILFIITFIGIVGGVTSTYFSVASLVDGESGFTVPCYVNASVGNPSEG